MTPWLSGKNVRLCNFQRRCSWVRVTAWTSLFIRYIYRLFTRNSRNTNSACLNCTGVSPHKLTPWRPSKRCNPAIRRGVLKKSCANFPMQLCFCSKSMVRIDVTHDFRTGYVNRVHISIVYPGDTHIHRQNCTVVRTVCLGA